MSSLALTLAATPAYGSPHPNPCYTVNGLIRGAVTPVLDGEEVIGFHSEVTQESGDLGGDSWAHLLIDSVDTDGTMHLRGSHWFVDTIVGDFQTSDTAVVSPAGDVHNDLVVIRGDASGRLHTDGQVDLATGELRVQYRGTLCL
jgi:hypothetical protein